MAMAMALCCGVAAPQFLSSSARRSRRARISCNASGSGGGGARVREMALIGGCLFGAGFVLGPLLDGIHSSVELQVYDNLAFNVGPLHTNLSVFPILGTFYSVVGLLHLKLDEVFLAKNNVTKSPTSQKLTLCFIFLVGYLELSAQLYRTNVPYNIEAYALFAGAKLNWALFEGTLHGFALASLVGVLCPALEIPIIKWFHLWHYSKPDLFVLNEGLVSWVICCYFAYTPFLSNLSRWLEARIRKTEKS